MLDQTILQAITYLECYLAKNNNAMPFFLREIALIALEIAIKNNEDKVLSLEECVYMIDKIGVSANSELNATKNSGGSGSSNSSSGKIEKFNVQMFAALERHMLLLLRFKVNIPTALDFALFFAHSAFPREEAQFLVQRCLPWIYFVAVNHDINRFKKPSAIALASLCHSI